ncbi:MAG: hypothetical protein P9L99_21775 [Candidatus Lernaella stagnicola]|nr:hypothetical protein [Candidatus Lernaella stagnicola]
MCTFGNPTFTRSLRVLSIFSLIVLVSLIIVWSVNGCSDNGNDDDDNDNDDTFTPIDDDDDDDNNDDDAPLPIFEIDFEDYELGYLDHPDWEKGREDGASRMEIVDIGKDGGGQALQVQGGTAQGDIVQYFYQYESIDADFSVEFDFMPADGAYFAFGLYEQGSINTTEEVIIEMQPPNGYVLAYIKGSSSGRNCGVADYDTWHTATVVVHIADETFDVLLDGDATLCADMDFLTGGQNPFSYFGVMETSAEGYGGTVTLDNFLGEITE